tara:strand:+ start:1674 stop:3251 length:1578 start_codon:yes stop_codon:yes gene_type:complete
MNYIIQVILFQVLFLAIYDFFLSKETFFTKNRFYLLATPIISFLLPFIKIPRFQKTIPQEFIIHLPEIFLSPERVIQQTNWYPSINYIDGIFWLGIVIFSTLFFIKLITIVRILRKHRLEKKKDFTLVSIPKQTNAFSFFNYIFLGEGITESQRGEIITHELVHCKQKHSLDLLFFEVLKIVMWFNPLNYSYQNRITLVHEYISDAISSKNTQKENYINNLLSNFFQVENIAFINQFYKQSFIKKRIIMMTKKESKKKNQLKYLVLIPVLASMLFYTSCSENELVKNTETQKELQTRYRNVDGDLVSKKGTKETFLDSYIGVTPPLNSTEIPYNKLSNVEKKEHQEINKKLINRRKKDSGFGKHISFKFYKMENGRNTSGLIFDIEKMKAAEENKISESSIFSGFKLIEKEGISFMKIDKAPTFPGCEEGNKSCFSKMVQKHFSKKFNAKMIDNLGLEQGKAKIFIAFKIDKEGNVIEIKSRAPHKDIEKEVLKVMNLLPKMIPGEHNGEAATVNYSIPFTIFVE